MANKIVSWGGSPDAWCPALLEHGYPLQVEPGRKYELPADVAEALVSSSDEWHYDAGKPETQASILARLADASDDELALWKLDKRKKVAAAAAAAEIEKRAEILEQHGNDPAEGEAD